MKKRNVIYLLSLSFILSVFIFIKVNFFNTARTWESRIMAILIVLTAIFMLVTAYKSLIKRLTKGHVNPEKYARLFDLDRTKVSGEQEFYFTLEEDQRVRFLILDQQMKELHVLRDQDYTKGGHIVRYNVGELEPGIYFYCLETNNQRTMKKIAVQHVNFAQ